MTSRSCPVCGLDQDDTAAACERCGWDFSPLLGTAEQVRALLQRRLEEARKAWAQRSAGQPSQREPEPSASESGKDGSAHATIHLEPRTGARLDVNPTGDATSECQRPPVRKATVFMWVTFLLNVVGMTAIAYFENWFAFILYAGLFVLALVVAVRALRIAIQDHEWCEREAQKGNPDAQFEVGQGCENYGHPKYEEAVRWYRQAAEQGHSAAQMRLGRMYARGRGVPQNTFAAKRWLRLAASQGHAGAKRALARLFPEVSHTDLQATDTLLGGRYRDLGNGTVLDTQTDLQWMRCALGQEWNGQTCVGSADKLNWDEMFARVNEVNSKVGYADFSDWRVPRIDELETLIAEGQVPTIDQQAFPKTPSSWFWSSSEHGKPWDRVSYVHFHYGRVNRRDKGSHLFVRLVRG